MDLSNLRTSVVTALVSFERVQGVVNWTFVTIACPRTLSLVGYCFYQRNRAVQEISRRYRHTER